MPVPPAAAWARAESIARPALSMWWTSVMSMPRAPAACGRAARHSPGTASRTRAPLKRSASPSRRTEASVGAGIGLDPAGAEVRGDFTDRLARQRGVELLAEGLHEGHALDHEVEHAPAVGGLPHQVVDRNRLAALAKHLAGHAHAEAARQRRFRLHAHAQLGVEVQQRAAVA